MAFNTTHESSSSHFFSSSQRWKYDVFLSFRGEDTRYNFTDHIYLALKDAGINTFMDNDELRRGEDIATELIQAIQDSRISLIVFSRNYAASRWCLEELVNILECRQSVRQLVLPIFYDVDPSDVRNQTASFGEAFAEHERYKLEMDKVGRWRAALTEAGSLSGWDLTNAADRYEGKLVKKIVEKILSELNHTYLYEAIYPVGMGSRVQSINSLLKIGSNDVRVVGILGMGGIGKTTLVKAVYNQFFHIFECKSFLENVREISKQPDGLVRLQGQLLYDTLKTCKLKISSVDRGINMIKERLCNRRVLVILDDVDQLDQLNATARKRDWFGPGSRIIITTRDVHLLKKLEVDEIHMARKLNDIESLELFSWHAFGKIHPDEDYVGFAKNVVNYAGGLPLALEVLGSYLFSRSKLEWQSAVDKLKKIPHDQIVKKLRISFDALGDDKEKDIFLDIACFFIGVDKNYIVQILDGCGFFAEIGISNLVRKCLLTIENNKLMMHDLLRDMGREIVREISPKEPGKRSRLWVQEDVIQVLTKQTGTEVIEGLFLEFPKSNEVHLSTEAFVRMQNLRLLQLNNIRLVGNYDNLSKELRLLCWHGFSLKFIPNNFRMENLVVIDMQYSNLKQVWKDMKFLNNLRVLNLSHSHYLTETPDFSKLPNLKKLVLEDCTNLVEIHQSIGLLDQLVLLNMKDCNYLKNLPRSIYRLKSLEVLILSGCSRLNTLLDDVGEMESLIVLQLDGTDIRQVPVSIVRLKNLKYLSLCGCEGSPFNSWPSLFWSWVTGHRRQNPAFISLLPTSLKGLNFLEELSLEYCNMSDDAIPEDLGSLPSLKILNLRGNNFCSLPTSFGSLSKLFVLILDNCTRLEVIPKLPRNLTTLFASNCTSLERINLSGWEHLSGVVNVFMKDCNNLRDSYKERLLKALQEWCKTYCCGIHLPGNDIPDWFNHRSAGPSLSFEVPRTLNCKIRGIIICFVYAFDLNAYILDDESRLVVMNKTKDVYWTVDRCDFPAVYEDHLCLICVPWDLLWCMPFGGGDEIKVTIESNDGINIKKTGVYLAYDNQDEEIPITFDLDLFRGKICCLLQQATTTSPRNTDTPKWLKRQLHSVVEALETRLATLNPEDVSAVVSSLEQKRKERTGGAY